MDPVTRDDSAKFYAEATDPERMRAVVEEYLRVPAEPPLEVVECKVEFARRGPPRSLFQYQIRLRDPTSGSEWIQVVSGVSYGSQRTQLLWESLRRHRLTQPDRGTVLTPAAYVPELNLLLQAFPFDHQMPALEALMTGSLPGVLAPLMARFGPGDWELEGWDATPVRYRVDLRACIRLTVRARDASAGEVAERRFFAKIYARESEAERSWGIQREVTAALAAGHESCAVAPPRANQPDERVLVQDEVSGVSLLHLLRSSGVDEATEAVRRTARAVASLHCLPINAPAHQRELGRTDPQRLRRSADLLRAARSDLASAVTGIEERVLSGLAAIGDMPFVPTHGDCKPGHALLEGTRVVLLDFDKFAAGEPMLDVTNMLLFLRRERKSRREDPLALSRAFVEEYFAHVTTDWKPRLAPHYAWGLLAEAASLGKSVRGKREGRRSRGTMLQQENRIAFLLQEAQEVLAGRAW